MFELKQDLDSFLVRILTSTYNMKSLLIIFSLFLSAQIMAQPVSGIFAAIGKGDVLSISAKFQSDVELCFDTNQDFYSKASAAKELNKFFSKVQPKSCKQLHEGSSKDKSSAYSVGELVTNKGKFRVFLYMEGSKIAGISFYPA
jgi:hypothetical protein